MTALTCCVCNATGVEENPTISVPEWILAQRAARVLTGDRVGSVLLGVKIVMEVASTVLLV